MKPYSRASRENTATLSSEWLPEITSIACAGDEARGPFGMKGVGEVAMNGPLPAVANALADGCAIALRDAPLTPERVLLALETLA